jgi:hypothetical protein
MAAVSAVARSLALGIVGGLAFLGRPAAAQQFSADFVATDVAGRPTGTTGKLYVANGAVRIETSDLPGSLFLVSGTAGTAYLVRPAQRIFMDAKQSSRLTQILVPVDPNDPCKQWQAMAMVAGGAEQAGQWYCYRLGPDSVAGRNVIKYQATSPQGRADYGWIDPQLKFPVTFQYEDGTKIELGNIREASQPARLFEIPADYRKFDPQQLIERIKQSDVWVEPPK